MSTLANLTVRLAADTAEFGSAMQNATRGLRDLRQTGVDVFNSTRTPVENYQASLNKLAAVYRTGKIDLDTYGRAVNQLGDEFRASQRDASSAHQAFSQIGHSLLGFSTGVGAAVVAANLVTDAIRSVGQGIISTGVNAIKLAADFEQTKVAFTTMLGSAAAAESTLASLSQFAAETPFEFPELADASKKLAAFGVRADQLVPTLRAIGDVSSGIGQPLGEIAEIYGKVRTQQRLYGDDIRQLGGRGIPIIAELSKQFGVTEGEVSKLVERGKVGFDNLQRAFMSLTEEGGRFHGMMEAQSQTLTGLGSTLKDNVNLALRDFGTTLSENLKLKETTQDLIELTNAMRDLAPEISQATGEYATMGKTMLTVIGVGSFMGSGGKKQVSALDAEIAAMNAKLARQGLSMGTDAKGLEIEDRGPDLGAQEKALKDFQSFSKGIDEQLSSVGLSGAQAKLENFIRLAEKGEIKIDTADIDTAKEKLTELDRAVKLEHAKDQLANFKKELEDQAATFTMSADAAKLWRIEQEMGAAAIDNTVRNLIKEKEARDRLARDKKKEDAESDREFGKKEKEAERLFESTRTPLEELEKGMKRLDDLREGGFLDAFGGDELFHRASMQLQERFNQSDGGRENRGTAENRALLRGTSEAFAAITRGGGKDKSPLEKISKDQYQEQKLMRRYLYDMLKEQRKREVLKG